MLADVSDYPPSAVRNVGTMASRHHLRWWAHQLHDHVFERLSSDKHNMHFAEAANRTTPGAIRTVARSAVCLSKKQIKWVLPTN
jgi:hypothetical protein